MKDGVKKEDNGKACNGMPKYNIMIRFIFLLQLLYMTQFIIMAFLVF
jgi:hypothetical protein